MTYLNIYRNSTKSLLAFAIFFFIIHLYSQETKLNGVNGRLFVSGGKLSLEVQSSRPLAKAADLLERRFGVPISYEDPEYILSDDLEDLASNNQTEAQGKQKKWLAPRATHLTATVDNFDITKTPDKQPLESSVENFTKTLIERDILTPGRRILQVGPISSGLLIRPQKNSTSIQETALDRVISMENKERSLFSFIEELCKTITIQQGTPIEVGNIPLDFLRLKVKMGAEREIARDLLLRSLNTLNYRTSWRLALPAF